MSRMRILGQNSKMQKTMKAHEDCVFYNVSIPASARTCPGAGACKYGCYAKAGRMGLDHAQKAYAENLEMIDDGTFWPKLDAELDDAERRATAKGREVRIRVHDTGDFFSEEYLQAWLDTARRHPGIRFYAYTKMVRLLRDAELPDNFRIVYSYGGRYDRELDRIRQAVPTAIVVRSDGEIPPGYVDGSHDDFYASEGLSVALRYHGPSSKEFTAGPQDAIVGIEG